MEKLATFAKYFFLFFESYFVVMLALAYYNNSLKDLLFNGFMLLFMGINNLIFTIKKKGTDTE